MRIAVVGCVGEKLSHNAPAKLLYTSQLFRLRRAYAERFCDSWMIQSALYHAITPDQVIEPYDKKPPGKQDEHRIWSLCCFSSIARIAHSFRVPDPVVEFHCGEAYFSGVRELIHEHFPSVVIEVPTEGLGIGKQLQWYAQRLQAPLSGEPEELELFGGAAS